MKVFLGGTGNESAWREDLIPLLVQNNLDFFNPIVDGWDEAAQEEEIYEREHCEVCLYTITPKMSGVYSIAEVVEDAIKRPRKTILNVLSVDGNYKFSGGQLRSLIQVGKMVASHGAIFVSGIVETMEAILSMRKQLGEEPKMISKTLKNSEVSGAKKNVSDLKVVGNGDLFRLINKAYSEREGWMKSTKAMETPHGCLVQVTTQQRNPDGSYALAEALSFVPDCQISENPDGTRSLR